MMRLDFVVPDDIQVYSAQLYQVLKVRASGGRSYYLKIREASIA
jgi:hypothetical protein